VGLVGPYRPRAMTGMMASAGGGSLVPTQGWDLTKSCVALAKAVQARTRVSAWLPFPTSRVSWNRLASSTTKAFAVAVNTPRLTARPGTQKLNPAAGRDAGMIATKDSATGDRAHL